MKTQIMTIVNSVNTSLCKVSLRSDDIIEIRFKQDEYEVDVKDQKEIESAVFELMSDQSKSYHILVLPGLYGGITKEAREMEMFESPAYKNQKAIVIVVNSLFQRILGSMYYSLKKKKPNYPYKLVASEALAMDWIVNHQKELNLINPV